ncbi:hypothetical protein ASF69_01600 [Rhizobium sp. Leaf311]|uniref:hypothetical protein n=1 Tax=Rhizobium sp. Leaf311 TaxID=1736332 RepID=UPI000713E4D7|nr:hypothetical protein [Rhizobium sp. Leaf311]KQQ61144.1 hypothetical protein ASF69_01600 [Rhizobium sp. Leaf311]
MQALIDVRDFYQKVRNIIGVARIRKVEDKNPTIDEEKQALRTAQADKDKQKKVVNLSDYRLQTASDLLSHQFKR